MAEPSMQHMARAILAEPSGQAFEAYYGAIRLQSPVEPTREQALLVLQHAAAGRYAETEEER